VREKEKKGEFKEDLESLNTVGITIIASYYLLNIV